MAEQHSDTTTWREMLDSGWEEKRKILDWKGLLSNHEHVHQLMLGQDFTKYHDWLTYARETHLAALSRAHGDRLTMLSLGCGTGNIETAVLQAGWPVKHLTCAEKDSALLAKAEKGL